VIRVASARSFHCSYTRWGNFMRKSISYMEPLFSLSLLPSAMSLPMVGPPVTWQVARHRKAETLEVNIPPRVSYLKGGYLNPPTAELSLRYRLLTSKDYDHFYAVFNSVESDK